MTFDKIVKDIKKQAEEWRVILNYKVKPKDKKLANAIRKGKSDPKGKSRSGTIHPGDNILTLLGQARYDSQFPRKLDSLCKDLMKEVAAAIPKKWPSMEYGDQDKLSIIDDVCNFISLLISEPNKQVPPEGEWSKPMSKREMMGKVRIHGYTKFNSWAKQYDIKPAPNRQIWTIRLDGMDKNTRSKFE